MITKTMIKTNRELIKKLNKLGVTLFYVDSEKDDFGSEIVFWDFKIKKGHPLILVFNMSYTHFVLRLTIKEELLSYSYKIHYPNHIVEYDDFYYISLVVYKKL